MSSLSSVRVNCRRKARKYLHQKDLCATFNLLCHEKRRLLYKATAATSSHDEQMNNYDRRQHSVLQRMSAFDRYKRKRSQVREHERKTAAADDDTPDQMRTDATAPSVVDQTTPPPPDLDMPLRIIDEVRQSFLNEFGGEDQSVERSVAAQEFARVSATIGSDLARRAKS